ncbi:EF-hand domain-containing protein [Psychromonas sp. PT13]|uniref:EF-hand domain-containing protein n=1 Tax=Psychromonas sp. PT13 TaxID=3439547 RepID=UPI003EC02B2B
MTIRSNLIIAMTLGFTVSGQAFASNDQQQGGEGNMPPPPPEFSSVDTNSDSEISLAELSTQRLPPNLDAETIFDEMDSNGDGSVSKDEYQNFKPAPPQGK